MFETMCVSVLVTIVAFAVGSTIYAVNDIKEFGKTLKEYVKEF